MSQVDCTICYDKGVIHFTDLAPSNKHQPTPRLRPSETTTCAHVGAATVNGMTLIEWLPLQLDDDEHSIRTWSSAHITIDSDDQYGDFLDRFGEDRMLAEVKAKRAVLDAAQDYSPELEYGDNGEWAFETVIKLLAQPYAGRDGWQDEWSVSE